MIHDLPVAPGDIDKAGALLSGRLRRTPVEGSEALGRHTGGKVALKLEHHQKTGSFKLRGATNAVLNLDGESRRNGIVGVSTGNHGKGLAHAAREAGVRCVICMSNLVPENKVNGIRDLGADVRILGKSQDEAEVEARRLVAEDGMTMLPPFDHPDVIAGQGTLGLDIVDQVDDIGTLAIPVSGGGLAAGVALAVKAKSPATRVVGVTMERGAAMHASLEAGHPVEVEELPTLADSLGGGIGQDNRYTFTMLRELLDDLILVSEKEIAAAIRHAYWTEKQIIEGSGAVAVAAILSGRIREIGTTVAVISGCNIDPALHFRIIGGEDVDVSKDM